MLILITSEKLAERRDPHAAANRAVTQRLGEQARNSQRKKWRKALMGKERAAQEQNGNCHSFALRGWTKNGSFSSPMSKPEENCVAECMDVLSKTTWMGCVRLQ